MSENGRGPSHLEDFVIISGLSGAGKSSVLQLLMRCVFLSGQLAIALNLALRCISWPQL